MPIALEVNLRQQIDLRRDHVVILRGQVLHQLHLIEVHIRSEFLDVSVVES